MNFVLAQPLGLLALLSLPLIVWMHRHVLRAQRREVSNLALWRDREQVAHEGRVRRRILDRLLLALQLLAACALSLVLAGFDVVAVSEAHPRLAVIIDGSASMAGGSGQARPLERVRAALAALAARTPRLRVTLITATESASLLGQAEQTPAEADAQLASYHPSAASAQLSAAEALASALGHAAASTLIFTDDPQPARPRLVHVGKPAENTAIVHAAWQPGEKPFVVLRQFGAARTVTLQIEVDGGRAHKQEQIQLDAAHEYPLTLEVDDQAQRVDVSLAHDALLIDDQATLLAPRAPALGVYFGELSPRLQRALQHVLDALPSLQPVAAERAELSVLENPSVPARGTQLAFRTRADAPATLASELTPDPFCPLVADFEPRGLVWYAFALPLPAASQVLVRDGARALMWTQGKTLTFNVDLERSNLLEHAAFPILFEHLVQELLRAQRGLPSRNFQESEPIQFTREEAWLGTLTLRGPSGQRWRFDTDAIALGVAPEPGLYALEGSGVNTTFAVQYAAAAESDLTRRAPEDALPKLALEPEQGGDVGPRLRSWFLLATLLGCLVAFARMQLKAAAR